LGATVSESIVRLSATELDDARAAYGRNYNYRNMNCGRGSAEITALVGTSKFQQALAAAAAAPRPWRHPYDRHLPAVLARRIGDQANVGVLIDGAIIGYLDPEVTARHSGQLDELDQAGQYLVCAALIVGGDSGKKFGVRLQIKPGVGVRWAAGARPATVHAPHRSSR
jgi:hypothetical protein